MTSSLVSEGKISTTSKTIARKRVNSRSEIDDFWRLKGHFIENDVYSSFLTSTDRNFNENKVDAETNNEDFSSISPICLEMGHSSNKYLTLDDFDDLEKK